MCLPYRTRTTRTLTLFPWYSLRVLYRTVHAFLISKFLRNVVKASDGSGYCPVDPTFAGHATPTRAVLISCAAFAYATWLTHVTTHRCWLLALDRCRMDVTALCTVIQCPVLSSTMNRTRTHCVLTLSWLLTYALCNAVRFPCTRYVRTSLAIALNSERLTRPRAFATTDSGRDRIGPAHPIDTT